MTRPNPDSEDGIPDTHNYTEAVGTRLTPKTKRRFDQYKEEEEIGNSEALRRIIRSGLDDDNGWRQRTGRAAFLLFLTGYPTLLALNNETNLTLLWLALIVAGTLFQPWIANATDRIPNPLNWL